MCQRDSEMKNSNDCKSFKDQEQESMDDAIHSPRPTLISPAISLSSDSEHSVDVNSYIRGNQENCTSNNNHDERLHKLTSSTLVNNENNYNSSNKNMVKDVDKDNRWTSNVEKTKMSNFSRNHTNEEIWDPPEAEDLEDDVERSVANYDDEDDEYGDGVKWGKPSSLEEEEEENKVEREHSESYRFKEDREKAMREVKNGKFKDLVSQLLKSVGVDSLGGIGESWVDIVTSLSWEAASFLKPDAIDGKAMDPDGYVKVKCIQTGFRGQSELVKGMVFKKQVANKHMPTTYKNPGLLLIRGMLGQSSSSLSSFDSMKQENEYLKSIIEMIEKCHPDVILVEKSVSRDVHESILAKKITLVYDMKLHRLERIARCTGSPIISSDNLVNQKLKHCDYFHIDKIVEEHAIVDKGEKNVEEHTIIAKGEKKPTKSLMFIEGCPTRLGCTILLKGSHSKELKRIKCVVQCAVVMAYQFILETSFLVDQNAMFSTIPFSGTSNVLQTDQHFINLPVSSSTDSTQKSASSSINTIDIPILNGFHEAEDNNASLSYEPYNPVVLSGFSSLSDSLKKVIAENFPQVSTSYSSLSSYFSFNGKENHSHVIPESIPIDHCDEETPPLDIERSESMPSDCEISLETGNSSSPAEFQSKEDIDTVLDSQSILVLMSSRNALRGTLCEQFHFSHIKFYRYFDIPLGRFLRDYLLNQNQTCSTCGELPEAHFYYYAHHNKQLTVQVKRIRGDKRLPGETEGKLWMWSRCGKCNGNSLSTKRLLISSAACGLSFGKFLELSFSYHSLSFSSCGHSLHGDFLHFFGLGPMVAMFSSSLVATYTILMPPQKLDFNNSIRHDLLQKETENVLVKGMLLFAEVENFLQKLASKYKDSSPNIHGSLKKFHDVEVMLKQERSQFEIKLQNVVAKNENPEVYKFLRLNRLLWELQLQACVWDQRLHTLVSPNPMVVVQASFIDKPSQEEKLMDKKAGDEISGGDSSSSNTTNDLDNTNVDVNINVQTSEVADPSLIEETPNHDFPSENILILSEPINNNLVVSSEESKTSNLEKSEGWMWAPFPEIRQRYTKDLQGGGVFEFVHNYIPKHLPLVHELITEEGSRLHIRLGTDDEYIVSDYQGELSSIISCALAMLKDQHFPLEYMDDDFRKENGMNRNASMNGFSVGFNSDSNNYIDFVPKSVSLDESRLSSFDGLNLFDSLKSFEALHPEVSFGPTKLHGKGKYSVVCVYSGRFRDLRNKCCPSELDYIASLGRCRNWDAKGGKSKAVFAKTHDDRFIIKEIKKTEFESFIQFAPDYFKYTNQSFESGNQSCLAKILGIYQVVVRPSKNGKEMKHDLMVMENLSFGRKISRQYDLKGALHARLNSVGNGSEDVLLDQNFVNDMNASPLYVSNKANQYLQRAIWNDTTFLNSINVMDYSLLVGVDSNRRELVCGIIDYLRQYTWDKQLETWVKSSLVVPKNVLPTVISPKEYKKRFRKFMSTHFFSVPDHWCSQMSPKPG